MLRPVHSTAIAPSATEFPHMPCAIEVDLSPRATQVHVSRATAVDDAPSPPPRVIVSRPLRPRDQEHNEEEFLLVYKAERVRADCHRQVGESMMRGGA